VGLDIKREAVTFYEWSILKEESGQGLTEYALILALIAIACVAAVTVFGTSLTAYFTNISDEIGAL
jgi:pilus assembly protein Flp/PilA